VAPMYSDDHIQKLRDDRARVFHQMKDIADRDQRGELRSEDEAAWQNANADYERLTQAIERAERGNQHQDIEERYAEARQVARPKFLTEDAPAAAVTVDNSDEAILRRLAGGELRTWEFAPERRDVVKTNTGAPVPTSFYDQLIEHLVVMTPMIDSSVVTVLNTAGGENLQIPRTSTYSAGTIVGEGTALGESDPAFQAFLTLGAYKFGALTQLSSEMLTDSGVADFTGFIARQLALGMATAVGGKLTNGTGTLEPRGIMTQAGTGVTGGTNVAGVPTGDNLIDLSFSVNSSYRRSPRVGWMCSASALAAIRKIKSSDGVYLYEPNIRGFGQPDTLLGFPVYENPDIAAPAINVNSVVFGDLGSFFVRQVGGVQLARSDEYAFNADLVTFRCTWRGDSGLPQQAALRMFRGGTA
jgi:HK97 family phage major capsid protein